MKNLTTSPILNEVISHAIMHEPFFTCILLQQKFVERHDIDTMAVDGENFFYNPDFLEGIKWDTRRFGVAHEALHIALKHPLRFPEWCDADTWNIACDYVVNLQLTKSGYALPQDFNCYFDWKFEGMDAETVARILLKEKEDENKSKGAPQPSQGGQGQPDPSSGNEEPSEGNEDGSSTPSDKKSSLGEVLKPEGKTDEEIQQMDEDISVLVEQAIRVSEKAGKMGSGLKREVQKAKTKISVEEILNRFISDIYRNDYSFSRPNLRYAGSGFILPSLYNQDVNSGLVIACDTSGSISPKMLSEQVKTVLDALLVYADKGSVPSIHIVYCDAIVHSCTEISCDDEIPFPKGGGGTRFSPVFKYVEENDIECRGLIYLTDGYCSDFPRHEPEYDVVWVLNQRNDRFDPPFGEVSRYY